MHEGAHGGEVFLLERGEVPIDDLTGVAHGHSLYLLISFRGSISKGRMRLVRSFLVGQVSNLSSVRRLKTCATGLFSLTLRKSDSIRVCKLLARMLPYRDDDDNPRPTPPVASSSAA